VEYFSNDEQETMINTKTHAYIPTLYTHRSIWYHYRYM